MQQQLEGALSQFLPGSRGISLHLNEEDALRPAHGAATGKTKSPDHDSALQIAVIMNTLEYMGQSAASNNMHEVAKFMSPENATAVPVIFNVHISCRCHTSKPMTSEVSSNILGLSASCSYARFKPHRYLHSVSTLMTGQMQSTCLNIYSVLP